MTDKAILIAVAWADMILNSAPLKASLFIIVGLVLVYTLVRLIFRTS